MNRFTAYAALFFMFSLCSTAKEAGFQHPAFNFRGTSTMSALSGDYSAAPTPLYKSWALPSSLNLTTQPLPPLTDRSYYELVQALISKMRLDCRTVGDMTWRHLSEMLFASWNSVKEVSLKAASVTLWAIISIWFGLYWTLARLITLFLWTFSIEALCLILLGCITSLIYKGALSLSEHLPVFLFMSPLKIIWRAAFSKRNYKNERAVEGYKGFSVPQKPPKSAVIELQHENGSHLGYANCIRLYSGENALVTAEHCLEGAFATSLKTGNRIPMSTFFPIFKSARNDISILVGPPNWEGLLSVKGAHFITADKIGKGPASFYTLEKGEWMCHSATIDGAHHQFVSVLCNTGPGYSGTGFWSSKNLLGVLKGFPLEEECNYNVMSVIPSIPGITSPNYVFESTAVKGRVFSDEAVKELEREASEAVKKLARFKSLTGKNWADDYDSDEDLRSGERGCNKCARRENCSNKLSREDCSINFSRENCSNKQAFKWASGTVRQNKRQLRHPRRRYKRTTNGQNGRTDHHSYGGENQSLGDRGEDSKQGVSESPAEAQTKEARKAWREEQAKQFTSYFNAIYKWGAQEGGCPPGFRKCGHISRYYHPRTRGETQWGQKLCQVHSELAEKTAGFGWPKAGSEAELQSLNLQAARWLQRAESATIPGAEARKRVIEKTVEAYRNCVTNAPLCSLKSKLDWAGFQQDIREAVQSLELDAGVGIPYIAYGLPTHRGWVEDHKLLPVLTQLTFDRLQGMSEASFEDMSAEELVQEGLCDPIRLFVKGEPHKQSKLDEGRYRLIMSVSLVDQLVARVLFQNQNKREISLWRSVPSKPGFGLSTDTQTAEFLECLQKVSGAPSVEELCANHKEYTRPTDCSGFDWSVAYWMLEDDMEVRNRLTFNNTQLTKRLRAAWLKCIGNSVLCLSDGTLLAQTVPGVQKSGSYNTSSSNSRIRVMAAYHCGADWAMAMGDDALEAPNSDLEEYKTLGFKVEVGRELEFCSHIFKNPTLAVPVNTNKMLYKLIHGYNPECGNPEVIQNYLAAVFSVLQELRHDRELVAKLHQWLVPSATTKEH
uniref:RNA-dependent RNA polymerase n=1 Tax=Potato leafroll virus TaxID=12045 RepID=V9PPE4_PLRV|nr:RNA-dependent RNA polymerase [Potato leafroll virus]